MSSLNGWWEKRAISVMQESEKLLEGVLAMTLSNLLLHCWKCGGLRQEKAVSLCLRCQASAPLVILLVMASVNPWFLLWWWWWWFY